MEASNRQPTAASCAWAAAAAAVAIAVNGLERGRRRSLGGFFHSAGLLWNHPRAERLAGRPGSSATSLAPICGIGRCRLLPLARPFAVDVTECGAGDYAERSGPHPRLCSFHASLRSVRPSVHAPSLSVVSLSARSDCKMPANFLPSLPSFHPFPRRHQSASPPAVLGGCKVLLSLRRAARSPLFASFVSLWSGKRLRLQSVPTRRPRGRTGRCDTSLPASCMWGVQSQPSLCYI